jgi:hypothetical protein
VNVGREERGPRRGHELRHGRVLGNRCVHLDQAPATIDDGAVSAVVACLDHESTARRSEGHRRDLVGVGREEHVDTGLHDVGESPILVQPELAHHHHDLGTRLAQLPGQSVDQRPVRVFALEEVEAPAHRLRHPGHDVGGEADEATGSPPTGRAGRSW